MFLKKRSDHNIWNNEKRKQYIQTEAVLTLLTDVYLKTFVDAALPLHNFKFQEKNCSIVDKILFHQKFSQL